MAEIQILTDSKKPLPGLCRIVSFFLLCHLIYLLCQHFRCQFIITVTHNPVHILLKQVLFLFP